MSAQPAEVPGTPTSQALGTAHDQADITARLTVIAQALRAGKPVIVVDDADRENEADVILSAATATEEWVAWSIRHTSGILCAPVTDALADRLELPLMVANNEDVFGTAYTVSIDAASGVTTGISAADRLRAARILASPDSLPSDLRRPGHLFPLRARPGGLLERRGHTEAGVDLCRLAALPEVALIAELVHDHGAVMRERAARELAAAHDLPVITIDELVNYLRVGPVPLPGQAAAAEVTAAQLPAATTATPPPLTEPALTVSRVATSQLPTKYGNFTAHAYTDRATGLSHLALVSGTPGRGALVRVHSECLTGDAFGSLRCDCGPQLETALKLTAAAGGVVIHLAGHEGRGIGLAHKIAAYGLQDAGADTVDANIELGLPVDSRDFAAAAAILRDLGVSDIELLTNNPAKVQSLRAHGVSVAHRRALAVGEGPHNLAYLRTKADRLGHNYQNEGSVT